MFVSSSLPPQSLPLQFHRCLDWNISRRACTSSRCCHMCRPRALLAHLQLGCSRRKANAQTSSTVWSRFSLVEEILCSIQGSFFLLLSRDFMFWLPGSFVPLLGSSGTRNFGGRLLQRAVPRRRWVSLGCWHSAGLQFLFLAGESHACFLCFSRFCSHSGSILISLIFIDQNRFQRKLCCNQLALFVPNRRS